MAEAIQYDGFSLLDIWELCTAYFVVNNDFGRKEMLGMLDVLGMKAGLIQQLETGDYAKRLRSQGAIRLRPTCPAHPIDLPPNFLPDSTANSIW